MKSQYMIDPIQNGEEAYVLSIQSHVAFGYVGNRAAVMPLNALGLETIAVHTVQLSNHTGYGAFKGEFFTAQHIQNVLDGVEERGLFPKIRAVLTGYLGDPTLGDIVLDTVQKIRDASGASVLYTCDPVMGDVGRGFFVKDALPPFFKDKAIARADIITPNQFELEYLTDHPINSIEDAYKVCDKMHELGVEIVLLTSLEHKDTPDDQIEMMASTAKGRFLVTTPKIHFDPAPNGSGDCTAALFCGHILKGCSVEQALCLTAGGIYGVFEKTKALGRRELALVQSQGDFDNPAHKFPIIKI